MSHSITNLKASHYKSAFRTLYSLFDKIAYFINRFFDLNDIKYVIIKSALTVFLVS